MIEIKGGDVENTMKKGIFQGKMKVNASFLHPLQTQIDLVLTPFTKNKNKQGIPLEEANNFISTALNQPFKIRTTTKAKGHDFAIPVGTITHAELVTVEDEQLIIGKAILWKDEFPEIDSMLRAQEEVHTSWELYSAEESTIDEEGVEWLHGIIFAATCVVDNPAYGGKTPVLNIAEDLTQRENKNMELEAQLAELQAQFEALKAEKETLVTELSSKVAEYEAREEAKRVAELRETRLATLKDLGFSDAKLTARADYYVGLTDEAFNALVEDVKELPVKTVAEDKNVDPKVKVPEPFSKDKKNLSGSELAKALRESKVLDNIR